MKHVHSRDLQRNFSEVTKDLSEPLVVTKHGNPVMTISAAAQSVTPLNGGAMFEAQSMSVFNSEGFSDTQAEDLAEKMRKLFESNTRKEDKNEEKHTHNPS